ncbi:hypothetical protein H2199_006065 [Coniosporium tulheliwenetii]|uniref:Uncharacterized protein n=1 Tax=Coniosporium tulheliwenetii TaxID=3383036 RepID=A0ACC2YZQ5_9PEZI|nr:hypothetical protein H2199_006065 [Cladosporium sp. JES 115]
MDVAYDHIQEETFPDDPEGKRNDNGPKSPSLNTEFQEAYKAFSSSPWGTRLGGFFGTVKKQGESYYEEAQKELGAASKQATKGLSELQSTLLSRTRALSISHPTPSATSTDASSSEHEASSSRQAAPSTEPHPDRPDSLPADIVKEAETLISRFRSEAAKRLKDIEKAEDAADEALLKFGANIRNFLRDAVTIAPPTSPSDTQTGGSAGKRSEVLFESTDAAGKRVIHTTRFDAQLHVIHTRLESFERDPDSPEWEGWVRGFDVGERTEEIAKDLEQFEELRRAMERLVPEEVEYRDFWRRYYFLRHVIEEDERRRKEMLKGAAALPEEEEAAWGEDSESEAESESTTPNPVSSSKETLKPVVPEPEPETKEDNDRLKPAEPRRSNDQHSTADSDASYDIVSGAVSGATSRAPGSPKEEKKEKPVQEESDEEDWE